MFSVSVRSHMMIAHSFRGDLVDLVFQSETLGQEGVVLDIGRAIRALKSVLADFNYKNLDEHPDLQGSNTTTEFMAKVVFDRMRMRIQRGELGPGSERVTRMKVVLNESHVARAGYEGMLSD